MKLTPEMLAKAKMCKSAEELLAFAKENSIELTEEEARRYFSLWHREGVLADEELENVSGGSFPIGCSTYSSDPPYYLITTVFNVCDHWRRNPRMSESYHDCEHCDHRSPSVVPLYCYARSAESDPLNSYIGGSYLE